MKADQVKWNIKYGHAGDERPLSASVERFWSLAPPEGQALDLAAGLGGNALFLADKGFHVDAVDISNVAVDRLNGRHPRVTPIHADLDVYTITPRHYDLIINTHFLLRRLFPQIIEGLKPGGLLIFETFMEGAPLAEDDSACREYLLRPNELLHACLKLHILFYEERQNVPPVKASHLATLVARR